MHSVPYSLRIEPSLGTRMLISGQSYHLNCTVSLTHTTVEDVQVIAVHWLNVTSNGTASRITSNSQVSVSNLTRIRRNEYVLILNFLEVETYHSGEYACCAEIDGIIRKNTVTISVNRKYNHMTFYPARMRRGKVIVHLSVCPSVCLLHVLSPRKSPDFDI